MNFSSSSNFLPLLAFLSLLSPVLSFLTTPSILRFFSPHPMDSLAAFYVAGVSASIARKVHEKVTLPFIDERFHLAQTATYCCHRFSEWDNKITTPPGLYLLGTAYSHVLSLLGVKDSCGFTALRSLNLVGGIVVLPGLLSLVKTRNYKKLNIVSLPLLYTYYFLFYTDVWSTIFVVAGVVAVISQPNLKGLIICNVVGFLGLWFRQTNILWIAMCAVILIEQRIRSLGSVVSIKLFLRQSIWNIRLFVPFAVNAALFAAFIKYNGGITFGDKENHKLSLHLVQVFYCWCFVGVLTSPLWFSRKTIQDYIKFATGRYGLHLFLTLASYFAIFAIVKNFTVVHPFLLADNRHYTFYIYRRILSKPWAKYALVPVYHFFTWLIPYILSRTPGESRFRLSGVGILAFVTITTLTIIPSPLFEPRYYIVPLVIFRLFTKSQASPYETRNHLCEFVWYLMINAMVFIVFFSYEFRWLTEEGIQRIIW